MIRLPCVLGALLLLAQSPTLAGAQQRDASPVNDLLERIAGDINDLRYADAVARGRALATTSGQMPLTQRVRLRLLMGAAFYPDDPQQQQADSAIAHLREVVRLAPDVQYAADMRWRGLDSLLERARAQTFGAVVRADSAQRVGGVSESGRFTVVSTRPIRVGAQLLTGGPNAGSPSMGTVIAVPEPTAVAEKRVDVRFAAHRDGVVQLRPGTHELMVIVYPDDSRDSLVIRHRVIVEGALPMLEPAPVLTPSALLPERMPRRRGRLIATGLAFGGATVALATLARSDASLRDSFSPDSRAYMVGGAMLIGVAAVVWRDKGSALPENVAKNAELVNAHEQRVNAVASTNRGRLGSYRVVVRIAPEPQ